jgi:hypothetical protein
MSSDSNQLPMMQIIASVAIGVLFWCATLNLWFPVAGFSLTGNLTVSGCLQTWTQSGRLDYVFCENSYSKRSSSAEPTQVLVGTSINVYTP